MLWRLLYSSALVTVFVLSAAGQTPQTQSPTDPQQEQKKAQELKATVERKTNALLDEVAGSAQSLKLPENRALVLSGAADLLWPRDEKRARALFRSALIELGSVAVRYDNKMSPEQRMAYWMLAQQRREILQMVARHDVDLALELLSASRPPTPSGDAGRGRGMTAEGEEFQLEQTLTAQIAANDPKRALRMAEDSLSKGISIEILQVLNYLNEKDSEMAGRLADDIIRGLHSANLSTTREAAWLAVLLLRTGIPPEDGSSTVALGSGFGGRKPYRLTDSQAADLFEMVTMAAMADPPNPTILSFLPLLMPEIEKRMPARAPALRRRVLESAQMLNPAERVRFEYSELLRKGTVEALLEAAAKAGDKTRDMLYEQAGWKALYGGDEERARRIVSDNIRDSSARSRILQDFDRTALWNYMSKDKMDEVRRLLARIKSKEERASILTQLAWAAAVKKDRKSALALLDEARPLINFKPRKNEELYTVLQIVRVYALAEPEKAFQLIDSLVGQANELLDAASVLNGFLLPSGMFRKGEMMLAPGYSNIAAQFRQFGKELAALALVDFDRTRAAADKFNRNEIRIMARLLIAQGVLSEQLGSGPPLNEGGVLAGN